MLNIIYFFLIFTLFSISSFAYQLENNIAKIIELSTSGKTLVLDQGDSDRFSSKEVAYLLGRREVKGRDVYYPAFKIRLIKERNSSSIWGVTKKFENISEKVRGKRFLFYTATDFLKGRSEFKIARKKIVLNPNNKVSALKEGMSDSGDSLATRQKRYTPQKIAKEQKNRIREQNDDFVLIDVDKYMRDGDRYKANTLFKSPLAKDFNQSAKIIAFDKMILAFLSKANGPQADPKNFYRKQRKDKLNQFFREDAVVRSEFRKRKDEEAKSDEELSVLANNYQDRGVSWSDNLSDDELSRVLFKLGELKERERQITTSSHQFDHQVFYTAGFGAINNQDQRQVPNSSKEFKIGVSFESFILKEFQSLQRLSTEFAFAYSSGAVQISDENASLSEFSLAGFVNWYPFTLPTIIKENIIFVGAGVQTNFSTISLNDGDQANFQSLVFPAIRVGVKYNFASSYGMRFMWGYSSVIAEQVASKGTRLDRKVQYADSKIEIALSKFF